ncbi:hypothetical protein LPW11_05000 [Geomonas sp. RF6]|uniref:hypothetical protein n=1 Tax=Geomonas sp. RF6 TaxID=2897342 RepID=UPI001E62D4FD|nr:hypothetical protein [Geomonas sp. RF6]UFS71556.1 hypothetical protein LPW11_05000 [Geomonas sp. RF6]
MTGSARRERGLSEKVALAVKAVFVAIIGSALLRLSSAGPPWGGLTMVGALSVVMLALAACLDRAQCADDRARKSRTLAPTGTRPS